MPLQTGWQQAQTVAEQRVEQHTEEYRLQVSPVSDPVPARDFPLGPHVTLRWGSFLNLVQNRMCVLLRRCWSGSARLQAWRLRTRLRWRC